MINLLPQDIKSEMSYGRKNRRVVSWLMTTLFGVAALFVVAAVGRITIQTARNQALIQKESMQEQLENARFDETSAEYASFIDGLGNTKKLYGQQILYSRLLRKLGTLLPSGSRLTTISLSDEDRAIGLNFENDVDGLGPVIQLNLTNQSKQVIEQTRNLLEDNLKVRLAGIADDEGKAAVTTNPEKQLIVFFVSIGKDENEKLKTLEQSLKNGGDMAFYVLYDHLQTSGFLDDYRYLGKQLSSPSDTALPQIRSYTILPKAKAVDFVVAADSIDEAKAITSYLINGPNSMFIETYTFEDTSYANKQKCKDNITDIATCSPTCRDGGNNCGSDPKICQALVNNGCRYTIRAYYDELFETASIRTLSDKESNDCSEQDGALPLTCTHEVTATYSQLFSQVDINRVSACSTDLTTRQVSCPVELRAEFSDDAKFYLLNEGAN